MTSTLDTATVNRRVTSINETLNQRVTAHLEQFGMLARPVLWTGKSSIVVHFTTDLHVVSMDTRFEPLMLNWTSTFRATDGAIYFNVPAAWRRVSREAGEGEAEVKTMTAPMKDLLLHMAAGATVEPKASVAVYPDLSRFEHFKYGTFVGLIDRKYVELTTVADADGYEKSVWVISDDGLTAAGLPPKSVKHDYERFSVGDHIVRKSDKAEFVVTAVDGDFISGARWYGVEVPAGARRAIGQPDTKISARVELIERAHRKHFARVQDGEVAPLIDPTAPLPVNEIENADEPHDDIGTGIDPEPANNLPDVQPADPYAWATPERRAEIQPISEKLTPVELNPTTEDGVWLIEDAVKEKTMLKGLKRFGVTILSIEEDVSVDEDTEGEPYTIARFTLGRTIETPYPSKRQTKPVAMPDSLYAQYDALHATLPVATQLLIQANGDEWIAFQMDAMLLRRYAPFCRFSPQTVNHAGEQWDKLSIPAGLIDETVTNATEGGLTIALASIVRDEAGALPVREVTEIHTPGEPVQYVGHEDPPTDWETEADADSESQPEPTPSVEPAAPSKLELTPELQAAKIKLNIVGGLRLGLVESVTPMPHDGWFAVTFVHGLTETFTVPALKTAYEVGDVWRSKRTVYVREQQTAPHGDANAQADAVIAALDEATTSIVDAFASLAGELDRARTALDDMQTNESLLAIADLPTPYAEASAVSLLDEAAERDLIAALMRDYPDLNATAFGTTQFLLNVIATLRAAHPVAAPF